MEAVTAFGQTVDTSNMWLCVKGGPRVMITDEILLLTNYLEGSSSIILSAGGAVLRPEEITDETGKRVRCNYHYSLDEGKIKYVRNAAKYATHQMSGAYIEACVSRDELFREYGVLMVRNGEIVHIPKKVVTISEHVDLQQEYEHWFELHGWEITMTLDEFLAKNAKKYEKAE